MPRTWHYSHWRRLALQGAMCLLLAVSVGAAAWIGQKRRPAAVTLGAVTQHGLLRYALPNGWDVETNPLNPSQVMAEEPLPHGRMLQIAVERTHRRVDVEGLTAQRSRDGASGEPIEFLG